MVVYISEENHDALIKEGWIRSWLVFDTQAVDKKVLKELLEKMSKNFKNLKDVKIMSETLSEPEEVEPVEKLKAKGFDKVLSQVLEMEILTKDFETLFYIVVTFGPTALEVMSPKEIKLDMRQMQNTLVLVSELMHKYASAGLGGVMLTKV